MGYGTKTNTADYRVGDMEELNVPVIPTGNKEVTIVDALNFIYKMLDEFGIKTIMVNSGATEARITDERITSNSIIEVFSSDDEIEMSYTVDTTSKTINITFDSAITTNTRIGVRISNPSD